MREAVVDASAMVEWLLDSALAEAMPSTLGYEYLAAPEHMDAEVLSALRGKEAAGDLSETEAAEVLADLIESPLERYPVVPLVEDAWEMRHNMTAYDALYVALARRLGCELVTADRRWAGVPDLGVPLTFISASS